MERIIEKNEYDKLMCIYKIINNETGKVYIGSTINFKKRINSHIRKLANNDHDNSELQKDWNIYQSKNFSYEIVEKISDRYSLPSTEKKYIDIYKKQTGVYNKSDPMEERIQGRFKKKKRYKGKNEEGVIYKFTQVYIINWLTEKFKKQLDIMHIHIDERIYFDKEIVDKWVLDNIDNEDIRNDGRIEGLLHKLYNKNGFHIVSSFMYEKELKEIYNKPTTKGDIIVSPEIDKKLYAARRHNQNELYKKRQNLYIK